MRWGGMLRRAWGRCWGKRGFSIERGVDLIASMQGASHDDQ
jgi:hypothetical protein